VIILYALHESGKIDRGNNGSRCSAYSISGAPACLQAIKCISVACI